VPPEASETGRLPRVWRGRRSTDVDPPPARIPNTRPSTSPGNFPVLSAGPPGAAHIARTWDFSLIVSLDSPAPLDLGGVRALPSEEITPTIHCG